MAAHDHVLGAAFMAGDADAIRAALASRPELKAALDQPVPGAPFGRQALLIAVSNGHRAMIDVLLEAGADINVRSHWWAGGFGVLDSADAALVPFLLERGARLDANAAAKHGMRDALAALLEQNPALVHARGGDGQTPLHVAATVEIAQMLLDHGADIDARDVDHESTPAQYLVREHQDVARYLVARGCHTDILMAAALGDLELVRRHLDADPACVRMQVSEQYFPKKDPRAGGTIYTWTLGADKTAHAVAREGGHLDVLAELVRRSPVTLQLTTAARAGDEAAVRALLGSHPDLLSSLAQDERRVLADAARDDDLSAVRVMVAAGWPTDVRGQHHATPLHWAAWNGNLAITQELLRHSAPVDVKGDEHDSTPLGWATYGSVHGWRKATGNYTGVVQALLQAGATRPALGPDLTASDAVRAVLER